MKNQSSYLLTSWDKTVLILSIGVSLASLYRLIFFVNLDTFLLDHQEQQGELTVTEGRVQRRKSNALVWEVIDKNPHQSVPIFFKDTLFVEPHTVGILSMDGAQITLEDNTLFKLDGAQIEKIKFLFSQPVNKRKPIALSSLSSQADVSKRKFVFQPYHTPFLRNHLEYDGETKKSLLPPQKEITISKNPLPKLPNASHLKPSNKMAATDTLKTTPSLRDMSTIKKESHTIVAPPPPQPAPPKSPTLTLLTPKTQSILYAKTTPWIRFSWSLVLPKTEPVQKDAANNHQQETYILTLSKTPHFDLPFTYTTKHARLDIHLDEEGTYYWKVQTSYIDTDKKKHDLESPTSSFTLSNQKNVGNQPLPSIKDLSTQKESYLIEIAEDEAFQKILTTTLSKNNQCNGHTLDKGTYYCRITNRKTRDVKIQKITSP